MYIDDEIKKAVTHVRRPAIPWRDDALTECGLPSSGHPVMSREDFIAKVKREGQQRSAMTTCMTCWQTARNHPSWQEDPVGCISREVQWNRRDGGQFKRELRAIAALISRHADEFAELIQDQQEIVPLKSAVKSKTTNKSKW